jgi:hypothetical protein
MGFSTNLLLVYNILLKLVGGLLLAPGGFSHVFGGTLVAPGGFFLSFWWHLSGTWWHCFFLVGTTKHWRMFI